jgi:hypothetical protein
MKKKSSGLVWKLKFPPGFLGIEGGNSRGNSRRDSSFQTSPNNRKGNVIKTELYPYVPITLVLI